MLRRKGTYWRSNWCAHHYWMGRKSGMKSRHLEPKPQSPPQNFPMKTSLLLLSSATRAPTTGTAGSWCLVNSRWWFLPPKRIWYCPSFFASLTPASDRQSPGPVSDSYSGGGGIGWESKYLDFPASIVADRLWLSPRLRWRFPQTSPGTK